MSNRKIIHIDMDAFFASVEQRDNPAWRGKPLIVARPPQERGVVAAASYEARRYGLHSAMSSHRALQLCPQVILVPPRFETYRAVSLQIRALMLAITDLVEPLSLDEAYLDVTRNKQNLPYASEIAAAIRAEILRQTGLTASAGIAPNKFLAKIASDWRKPNGQFVIPPPRITQFLLTLPLGKIPGVGKKTLQKMHALGLQTTGDLQKMQRGELVNLFGRWGYRLYDLARGIDNRPVQPQRERLQISTEITLPQDLPLSKIVRHLADLSQDLWAQAQRKQVQAHTLTLKLKTADFHILTRSQTYSSVLPDAAALEQAARQLAQRMPVGRDYRLIGLGISHLLPQGSQPELWIEQGADAEEAT